MLAKVNQYQNRIKMRNVIYSINMSIDGCCDHTKFSVGDFEEIHDFFASLLQQCDQLVYGRNLYELMFPYWSDVAKDQTETKATLEFAETITNIEKVVFSHTLESVEGNARLMRGGLHEEIIRLKQLPGKKISVSGVNLSTQLMQMGLIDEYYFVVHPVIVGEGTRLFGGINLPENLNLKLVETRTFKSGGVGLHYVKG